jgi:hypothetical protein
MAAAVTAIRRPQRPGTPEVDDHPSVPGLRRQTNALLSSWASLAIGDFVGSVGWPHPRECFAMVQSLHQRWEAVHGDGGWAELPPGDYAHDANPLVTAAPSVSARRRSDTHHESRRTGRPARRLIACQEARICNDWVSQINLGKDTVLPTLTPHVHLELSTAEPTVVGALAVFPLISEAAPTLRYLSFAAAVQQGFLLRELEDGASVNDLAVDNPLDRPVLLYEGEEALGAQQNRTFEVSTLVAPLSRMKVPVSCVEAGRWDGGRHAEAFTSAPQTANPRLRRMKAEQARVSAVAGGPLRAAQGEVWGEVAAAASRHGVVSPTGAMHDVFEHRRTQLDAIATEITIQPNQVGMLAAIGGRFVVLDHVSEPEAFACLHPALVQGYALDALDMTPVVAPSIDDARDFLGMLLKAPLVSQPAVGMGEGKRFRFGGLRGSCLLADDEVVSLTAFANDPSVDARAHAAHVRRPSRRRPPA